MLNPCVFVKNKVKELFCETLEETCDTHMCRDTPFEKKCIKDINHFVFLAKIEEN
jgi:hypothetical protein